ncbi:interleukin-9 receptor isoform X2 [Siphateles boraxobius]|uniref:interleukin-9 receptor isoform X2 n=1 Tax=Siphateles boraxobius TaxID=180520 RepID=UPI004062FA05
MDRSYVILTLICLSDVLASFITLGDQYSLECLSNYLSIITCSLNISDKSLGNESSYWLHFRTNEEEHDCTLKRRKQFLLCELDLSPDVFFTDVDSYEIFLHSGYHDNNSVLLDADFMPHEQIRPVPPSNLSLLWEKDRALFQWESGYDPDSDFSLIRYLQYQLSVSSEHKLYEVEAVDLKVHVDESRFEPHTSYTVRVRSQPDQVHYKGVWSPWAPAIHWRKDSGNIFQYCLVFSSFVISAGPSVLYPIFKMEKGRLYTITSPLFQRLGCRYSDLFNAIR